MAITVITPEGTKSKSIFVQGKLVWNQGNGNIYLVISDIDQDFFKGIRLSGRGEFLEVSDSLVKDPMEAFDGQIIIKNEE